MRTEIFSGEAYFPDSRLHNQPNIDARVTLPNNVSKNDERLWTNLFWIVRWELENLVADDMSYYSPLWNLVANNDWDTQAADKLIDRAVLIANFDDISDDPKDLCDNAAVVAIEMACGALWATNERTARDSGMPRDVFDKALDWADKEKDFLDEIRGASRANHSQGGGTWSKQSNAGDARLAGGNKRRQAATTSAASTGWGSPAYKQQEEQPRFQRQQPVRNNRPMVKSNATGARRSFVTAAPAAPVQQPTKAVSTSPLEEDVPVYDYNDKQAAIAAESNGQPTYDSQIPYPIFPAMIEYFTKSKFMPENSKVNLFSEADVKENGGCLFELLVPVKSNVLPYTCGPVHLKGIAVKDGLGHRMSVIRGYVDGKTMTVSEEMQEGKGMDYEKHILGMRKYRPQSEKHEVNYAYYNAAESGDAPEGALLTSCEGDKVNLSNFIVTTCADSEAMNGALTAKTLGQEKDKKYAYDCHATVVTPFITDESTVEALKALRDAPDVVAINDAHDDMDEDVHEAIIKRMFEFGTMHAQQAFGVPAPITAVDDLVELRRMFIETPAWGGEFAAKKWDVALVEVLKSTLRNIDSSQGDELEELLKQNVPALENVDMAKVIVLATNVSTLYLPHFLQDFKCDAIDEESFVLAKWTHPEFYHLVHNFVRRLSNVTVDVIRVDFRGTTYKVVPLQGVAGAYSLTKI